MMPRRSDIEMALHASIQREPNGPEDCHYTAICPGNE